MDDNVILICIPKCSSIIFTIEQLSIPDSSGKDRKSSLCRALNSGLAKLLCNTKNGKDFIYYIPNRKQNISIICHYPFFGSNIR